MNVEMAPPPTPVESRPVRIARAVTWIVILAAAFWATAGWLILGYLRP